MSLMPCLIVAALLATTPSAAAFTAQPDGSVIAPELADVLAATPTDDMVAGYLVMDDQISGRMARATTRGRSPRAGRRVLADRLKAHTAQSQVQVRAFLDAAAEQGRAEVGRVLWMANALYFSATPAVYAELAGLPGINRIRLMPTEGSATAQDVAPPAPLGGGTASYPFFDDFETGSLGPAWTVETAWDDPGTTEAVFVPGGGGYVTVSSSNGPEGNFHALVATADDGPQAIVSMTVKLDLTGQTDVGIRFRHKEFGDESDAEDGVFVSDDGITYHSVLNLIEGDSLYSTRAVELDDAIAGLGLKYTSNFHIRFQWKDNFNIPTDGFAFDNIEIAPGVGVPPPPEPEPNIAGHQAPDLWALGYDGAGVLLGNIDAGVDITHPDLVNRIWTNPGEIAGNFIDDDGNGFVDDIHGWDFDNNTNNVIPTDSDTHGTKTSGIAVGDGTLGRATGMAPGATMVVAEIENEAHYLLAQQYMLDVGVDVVTSSYSWKWPNSPRPDYHLLRQTAEMELAAGIVHANSIGNQGTLQTSHPIPFNISAPGNSPGPFRHPDQSPIGGVTSVIACGGIQLPNDTPYNSSGVGPAAWEDITVYDAAYPHPQDPTLWDYPYGGFSGSGPGLLKPDVVAYTVDIMTTTIGGAYATFGGTSAATPHLGGALCLLRQVQPAAMPRHLAAALELTAVDLGPVGKDNQFGSGKFQVLEAARRLLVLGRFETTEPLIGEQLDLDLFGPADETVYSFLAVGIEDNGTNWNLTLPFRALAPFFLDGNGERTITFNVPNDPTMTGIPVFIQFGTENLDGLWGTIGPLLSVPERLVLTQ